MKRILIGVAVIIAIGAALFGGFLWYLTKPAPALAKGPVATIAQGELMAGIDAQNNDILQFNGIPFAAPPVGELRWRPPEAPASWQDVRDARAFGAECIQARGGSAEFVDDIAKGLGLGWTTRQVAVLADRFAPPPIESEDCLFLNVRTGNFNSETLQPVMVWIHGGSHQTGSGSMELYQANALVENGVVLVTINYRLGPLGYLAHPALSADDPRGVSGNYGLLDQIAALEWVQANIETFGGDPANVTIFGESAGAQSVSEIMASPFGDGLYHKAILQSGASTYNANGLTRAIAGRMTSQEAGSAFFEGLVDDDASADELRAISAETLIAQIETKEHLRGYLLPTVDGVVLPRLIGETIRDTRFTPIPVLAGYNADEATLFYGSIQAPTVLDSPFPETYEDRMTKLNEIYGEEDAAILFEAYGFDAPEAYERAATDMLGDDLFGIHMRFLAKANSAAGAPTWLYHFRRVPPSPKQTLGAFHAAEIFFVFDSHIPFLSLSDEDRALTKAMGRYWTNFAKTGNPNGSDLLEWPAYSSVSDEWITFSPEISTEANMRAQKLDVMERTLESRLAVAIAEITPQTEATVLASGDQETSTDRLQP